MTTAPIPLHPGRDPDAAYEAAVAACRAEMTAYGINNGRGAREMGAGVSTTTLSKWLRGLYQGDVPAVTARVVAWLDTRQDARRLDFAAAGLDRHVDLGVTEEVEAALAHAQAAGDIALVAARARASHGPRRATAPRGARPTTSR